MISFSSDSGRAGSKLSWVTPNRTSSLATSVVVLPYSPSEMTTWSPWLTRRQQGRGDGRHPRGTHQARLGPLDLRHLGGELDGVGMAVAGVEEPAQTAVVQTVDLVEVGDLVDRRSDRARGPGAG